MVDENVLAAALGMEAAKRSMPENESMFEVSEALSDIVPGVSRLGERGLHVAGRERQAPRNPSALLRADRQQARCLNTAYIADPRPAVIDWADDRLEGTCDDAGTPRGSRVISEITPTVWLATCFHLGRFWLFRTGKAVAEGREPGAAGHSADAACMDRLVTDDARFHKAAAWAPIRRDRFVTSEQMWAELAKARRR